MTVCAMENTAMYEGNFVSWISRLARSSAAGTISIIGYIVSYAASAVNKHISNLLPVHQQPTSIQFKEEYTKILRDI